MARTRKADRLQVERRASYQRGLVDGWNSLHAVGVEVHYREDDGRHFASKTRSEAQILGGHTAVIWIEGKAGCVSLERVCLRTVPVDAPR